MNNESVINNSNSMETAVKMVQPIVDIIFNAFEDQLKNVQSSISNSSPILLHQHHPPKMIPYLPLTPPTRPVVLHAVNFNIQLTTEQPTVKPIEKQNFNEHYSTNTTSDEYDYSQFISLTGLKQKVKSCILSSNLMTNHETHDDNRRKRRKLKRIVQLAVVGVSVLCGYFLL